MADVVNIIKAMTDVENISNDHDFFEDTVDTPKERIKQHRKRECLKSVRSRGKAYLLRGKWTNEKVEKAINKTISKTYVEYKQCEQNEKSEQTEKVLGKHVINLYSTRISWVVKIRHAKKLWQDIENNPNVKDQMAEDRLSFSAYVW